MFKPHPWIRNRFGLRPFFLVPIGWQGAFAPGHPEPEGVEIPGDSDMPDETNDLERILSVFTPGPRWKHKAVLKTKNGPQVGYLCYKFSDGKWRIRVRVWVDEVNWFAVGLSRQPTRIAFVDLSGAEIPLMVVDPIAEPNLYPSVESF